MDGATPIVVIDTDEILLSLQKATQNNKEAAKNAEKEDAKSQSHRSHTSNGSV
jgi:hypothetical protein